MKVYVSNIFLVYIRSGFHMKGGFPGIPSKPRVYFTILRESKIHIFLGEHAPRPLYLLPDYSTLINLYNIIIYIYIYIIIIIYLYETFKLIVIIQYLKSKLCHPNEQTNFCSRFVSLFSFRYIGYCRFVL